MEKPIISLAVILLLFSYLVASAKVQNIAHRKPVKYATENTNLASVKNLGSTKAARDSFNITFVSNWPFDAPNCVEVDTIRQYAFMGAGGGVYIFDISNSDTILKISEKIKMRGIIQDLYYANNLLYIAAQEDGFQIWDVATPSNSFRRSCLSLPGDVHDLVLKNNLAYVAAGTAGLRIVDVTNPDLPIEIGQFDTPGSSTGIAMEDSIIYLVDRDSIFLVDINIPTTPRVISHIPKAYSGDIYIDVAIKNHYIYVLLNSAVRSIDCTDPSNPILGNFSSSWGNTATDIQVNGNYVYFTSSYDSWYKGGLGVVDISNPNSPILISALYPEQNGTGLAMLNGQKLLFSRSCGFYSRKNGLSIVDISNPNSPSEIKKTEKFHEQAQYTSVSGDLMGVASMQGGLRLLDISTINDIREVSYCDTVGKVDLALNGNYGYCMSYNRLNIVKINLDSSVSVLSKIDTLYPNYDIKYNAPYCYFNTSSRFYILDPANPSAPVIKGFCPVGGYDFTFNGNYAYQTSDAGTYVIDISNPATPTNVATYPMPSYGIATYGDYIYIASDQSNGFYILNISDPSSPQLVGQYLTDWVQGYSTDVHYPFVYVLDWHYPVCDYFKVFDVSTPQSPLLVAYYKETNYYMGSYGGTTWGLCYMNDNYIVATDMVTGVNIYKFQPNWDVGLNNIINPILRDTLSKDTIIIPSVTIHNNGNARAYPTTYLSIGSIYSKSSVDSLIPGSSKIVNFPACTLSVTGSIVLCCSTVYFRDSLHANNTINDSFWVLTNPSAVTMSYFGALPCENGIKIEWETQSSLDSYLWEILRGQNNDSLNYDLIATQPGNGNTNQPKHWYYDDACAKGTNWYKLAEVDFSGAKTFYGPFSAIAGLTGANSLEKLRVFPNPVRDLRNIKLNKSGVYGVYNISGQKMGNVTANSSGQMQWQLGSKAVTAGVYFIVKQDTKETQKIQVIR